MSDGKIVHLTDKLGNIIESIEINVCGEVLHMPSMFKHFNEIYANLSSFKSRPSDIWIHTYPKAGTHWTNEILLLLLHGHTSDKIKSQFMLENCKDIDDFERLSSSRPRILNTHVPFEYLPPQIKKSKLVYVIRNPLAIALSRYHHSKAYGYNGKVEDYIESFAGTGDITFYGDWFEHTKQSYAASQTHSNILLMYYEEMVKDPAKAVRETANFVGREITPEEIENVVKQTTVNSMKERFTNHFHEDLRSGEKTCAQFIIRKGEAAEWKNYVTADFLKQFMERFNKEMEDYPEIIRRIQW